MKTARELAIANENRSIDENVARAQAAAKPRNALEAMAQRLSISPPALKNTLMRTVFSACKSDEEFMALMVVANEYGLNPLLKEIYAFPAKGGGIVPMVSVDGWIRIMNEHPKFDGIEFDYHADSKGGVEAIEAIIYRSDRQHPIKVIEYMVECVRGTDPWKQAPRRMLRHRALMQGARVAFGFSGIFAEGDEEVEANAMIDLTPTKLPPRQSIEEELGDEIPKFDKETGEVVEGDPEPARDARGMTQVDEDAARELDAGGYPNEPTDESQNQVPAWMEQEQKLSDRLLLCTDATTLKAIETEFLNVCGGWPKKVQDDFEMGINAKRKQVNQ